MKTIAISKRRKRYNRIVKKLSEIYNLECWKVQKLYVKANNDVALTKMFINLELSK